MGCLPSKPISPLRESKSKLPTVPQKMQPLIRPAHWQGKRPSFKAAYARAALRYGFGPGRNAGFAKRNNVVVKVKSKHDKDTQHEVPAESIQNGELRCASAVYRASPAHRGLAFVNHRLLQSEYLGCFP